MFGDMFLSQQQCQVHTATACTLAYSKLCLAGASWTHIELSGVVQLSGHIPVMLPALPLTQGASHYVR